MDRADAVDLTTAGTLQPERSSCERVNEAELIALEARINVAEDWLADLEWRIDRAEDRLAALEGRAEIADWERPVAYAIRWMPGLPAASRDRHLSCGHGAAAPVYWQRLIAPTGRMIDVLL